MRDLGGLYAREWARLERAFARGVRMQSISPEDQAVAYQALLKQSFYVGEYPMNGAIIRWIDHDLFKNGRLQSAALGGVELKKNTYSPRGGLAGPLSSPQLPSP